MIKFGCDMKKLKIAWCGVKEKQLVKWLNAMPQLEELNFFHMSIDNEGTESIPELNLKKLKKLNSYESLIGEKMNILKAIPAEVIDELIWTNCFQPTKAKDFLRKQPNIKKLQLGDDSLVEESDFNALQLKELTIKNDFDPPFTMFLQQKHLTSLTLKEVPLSAVMFNTICGMKQLQTLKLDVTDLPESSLVILERLSNLKSLMVCEGDEEQLDAIKELNMPQLESLGLWMFPELDGFWEYMDDRCDNIKKVRYGPCMDVSVLEDMMIEFPKIESIKIAMGDGDTVNVCDRFMCQDEVYNRLKKLFVSVNQIYPKNLDIMQFIDLCTNLEEIYLYFPLNIESLQHILSTKGKLQKLSMMIDEESSKNQQIRDKIVNPIDDFGKNVRAIKLVFGTNTWNMNLDVNLVKERLINNFPIIDMDACELNLKKRGVGPMEAWDD
jgi:hypothetical protein